MKDDLSDQLAVCEKWQAPYLPTLPSQKVGISGNVREGIFPINGLRHAPAGDTSGWYIWAGEELSEDEHFFQPLHVEHLNEWRPDIEKYLGLAPGWRFLIASNYEDVWFDASLLTN
jgi:hypothetical protein